MMNWINKKRNKKGFTLVELIVVIAILGVLGLIAVPRFATIQTNSKIGADIATANSVINAAKIYVVDKNLTNAEATAADGVTIAKLVAAKLLESGPTAQTNKIAMTIAVTEVSNELVYTVSATDAIAPTPAGVFIKK